VSADVLFGIPEHTRDLDPSLKLIADRFPLKFNLLDRSEQISFITSLGESIEACHAAGFCHLDLKPSNLIVPFGKSFFILNDLKIVRPVGSKNIIDGEKTSAGSEGYSPPEQYGTNTTVAVTMDIYALSVTLGEIMMGIETKIPFSFSEHLEKLKELYGTQVAEVFEKGWEIEPIDRYQTVGEFIQDLIDALRNQG
jgi:serine/threonine protein kinase